MGKLRFMTEPSSKVVLFIESKISFLIDMIPSQIRYIRETEGITLRKTSHQAPQVLPMTEVPVSSAPPQPLHTHTAGASARRSSENKAKEEAFKGEGSLLGSNNEQQNMKKMEEVV